MYKKNNKKHDIDDQIRVNTSDGFGIEQWRELSAKGANIDMKLYPTGVSMLPLIRGGKDQVMVKPIRRDLKKGDIVLFERKDGAHVLHRLWKIGEEVRVNDTAKAGGRDSSRASETSGKMPSDAKASDTRDTAKRGAAQGGDIIVQTFGDGCWYPDEPITRDKVLAIAYRLYRDGKTYNLDTSLERAVGRAWLFASPLRRVYYRLRGICHAVIRKLTGRGK